MTKPKIGIIEQARAAVEAQDNVARGKILKAIDSKKYRFASTKTKRKVQRLLAAN